MRKNDNFDTSFMHMFVYVQFDTFLLFGVNVELSAWLSVSFNVDLLTGPWSIGHVSSQDMVRLSNLDRAIAIDMVQSGSSCHDVTLTFGMNKSTITKLKIRSRETTDVKDRANSRRPRKPHWTAVGPVGRAVYARLAPNQNLGHPRQLLLENGQGYPSRVSQHMSEA